MADMIKLTGLWKNKSENGTVYLSGNIGSAKIMIFAVKEKTENGPDYIMNIAEGKKKEAPAPQPEDDGIGF